MAVLLLSGHIGKSRAEVRKIRSGGANPRQ
jgi:hypothetical protein